MYILCAIVGYIEDIITQTYIALAILQPNQDLEAGDTQITT